MHCTVVLLFALFVVTLASWDCFDWCDHMDVQCYRNCQSAKNVLADGATLRNLAMVDSSKYDPCECIAICEMESDDIERERCYALHDCRKQSKRITTATDVKINYSLGDPCEFQDLCESEPDDRERERCYALRGCKKRHSWSERRSLADLVLSLADD
jgi:hypothetical protein